MSELKNIRGFKSNIESMSRFPARNACSFDKCPDHGIDGFKRYVALAVVARNSHRRYSVAAGSGA